MWSLYGHRLKNPSLKTAKSWVCRPKWAAMAAPKPSISVHKLVIGADGVTSVVARGLRPKEEQHVDGHRAVALRAYIEDIEEIPQTAEFYLYEEINPGYAWIFSLGNNRANIGLGMRLDQFRQNERQTRGDCSTSSWICPTSRNGSKAAANCVTLPPGSSISGRKKGCNLLSMAHVDWGCGRFYQSHYGWWHPQWHDIGSNWRPKQPMKRSRQATRHLSQLKIYQRRCQEYLSPNLRRSYHYQQSAYAFPSDD